MIKDFIRRLREDQTLREVMSVNLISVLGLAAIFMALTWNTYLFWVVVAVALTFSGFAFLFIISMLCLRAKDQGLSKSQVRAQVWRELMDAVTGARTWK